MADTIADVGATAENIQKLFAVKRGIALSQAIDVVGRFKNFNLDNLKELLPPAEHETGYLNASQVGEKLGLGKCSPAVGGKVNRLLEQAELVSKDGRDWRLTEKGAIYGEEMPYTRNGHSGYQIRWNNNVLTALRGQLQ